MGGEGWREGGVMEGRGSNRSKMGGFHGLIHSRGKAAAAGRIVLGAMAVLMLLAAEPAHGAGETRALLGDEPIANVVAVQNVNGSLSGDGDTLVLLNLNDLFLPKYLPDPANTTDYFWVTRTSLGASFYVDELPSNGRLYQAYRFRACTSVWPGSCMACCGSDTFTPAPGEPGTCCAPQSDLGNRLFGIGKEITNASTRVMIRESGFLWYRPPKLAHGDPYDEIKVSAEYWVLNAPPFSPQADLAHWEWERSSGCAEDRVQCAAGQAIYCTCSNRSASLAAPIKINNVRRWPQVGFGGYMIALDGGDDYFSFVYNKLPKYEFTLQLWFQQNRRRPGQTLMTYWSDERGREFEIFDTSNLQFYHLNNRSLPSGVGINDGKWHHVAFAWRLICSGEKLIQGGTYCDSDHINPSEGCIIDDVCLRVDITIIVDGVDRATVSLPPFLPSNQGTFLWGQRMIKPLTTVEQSLKDKFFLDMRMNAPVQTSSIREPYVDNNLDLIFNNLRSRSLSEDQIFGSSVSKEAFNGPFTESEPFRDPYGKYCRLTTGGGFNPWTALSANMDEIRLYSYAKHPDDVSLDSGYVLNGDTLQSWSPASANYSLILYHSFDINSAKFKQFQRDDYTEWPMDVADESPSNGVTLCPACVGLLGGGVFQYSPLQVPSTAPLVGARTLTIFIPDQRDQVPIDLIDAVHHDEAGTLIYTRIDASPLYGELAVGADDCDNILTVPGYNQRFQTMPIPVCKGGLVGLGLLGTSGQFTSNCSIGDVMTATDGYGSGFRATVSTISATGGVITAWTYNSYGSGYDWKLTKPTNLTMETPYCLCGTTPGNVPGAMNRCFRPQIGRGKADISGALFTGISMDTNTLGFPINYQVSCSQGLCPVVKPRPCSYACHREVGWATDKLASTTSNEKQMVGPYGEIVNTGSPWVQWSNKRHTVFYKPLHLREYPYFIFDEDGNRFLQDTIKDEILVRYWDRVPIDPLTVDRNNPPENVHMWIQIGLERLAMPINTSFIAEQSTAVVTQLQVIDFDRGTSPYNAPFAVYADPPLRGRLFQAIQIDRNDTRFPDLCVCWAFPRFPLANHTPENDYYPEGMEVPSQRRCDLSKIGEFCMIKGAQITESDTLVTESYDTRYLPGFQHARDGFHVIYELGRKLDGRDSFSWRLKHPQGQVESASVSLQVRSANQGPVALNGTATLEEDTTKVITLEGSDMDDELVPTFHVVEPPTNGFLYQCIPRAGGGCDLGEKISRKNESYMQWADVTEDPAGALDGEAGGKVLVMEEPIGADPPVLNISDIGQTPLTTLGGGYGYGTYNFEAPPRVGTRAGGGFRQMCGARGSIAATLGIEYPVFVTGVDIFFPMRYDTPYRILAKRSLAMRQLTYDYKIDQSTGVRSTVSPSSLEVTQVGIIGQGSKEASFTDEGALTAAKRFTAETMTCDLPESASTACRKLWDGTRFVRGQIDDAYTLEPRDEWVELYRGLPLLSSYHMPGEGRFSPIFPPSRVFSSELRIEACGQEGRVYNDLNPPPANFIQALKSVRVTGTRTTRPLGVVTDPAKRVVYIPNPDFSGTDSFRFRVRDLSGGSRTSDWRFSRNQGWSPIASIGITVTPKLDIPLGTNSVASSPPADGIGTVLIPIRGSNPTDGSSPSPLAAFDVYIDTLPTRGALLTAAGADTQSVILGESTGFLRYRPPANSCGFRYASFTYRLRDPGSGATSATYNSVIDIRCAQGNRCTDAGTCEPCPAGEFGASSGIFNLCKLCPVGTYQPNTGQTDCISCSPGYYTDRPAQKKCRACAPGTASDVSGAAFCPSCDGGRKASKPASTTCSDCGTVAFTFGKGAFTCKDCPINTRSVVAAASSPDMCACMEGTYDVEGRTGIACRKCPPGAYCYGGKLLPVPRTGYWTNRSLWKLDDVKPTREINNSIVTGEAYFVPCNYRYTRGVCLGYPDINVQALELRCLYRDSEIVQGPRKLDELTSAPIDMVIKECTVNDPRPGEENGTYARPWISKAPYENNSYCSEGYTGTMCSSCAPGYRKQLEGYCSKCIFFFDWHWTFGMAWFFAVVGAFFFLWGLQFFFCAYPARSMYILITHLQLLAVIGRYAVPWPAVAQQMLNGFSFLNLNIDALHWNCIGWDLEPYWMRWAFEFILAPGALFFCWLYHSIVVRDETEVAAAAAIRGKLMLQRAEEEKARMKKEMIASAADDDDGDEAKPNLNVDVEEIREEESETDSVAEYNNNFVGGHRKPGAKVLAHGDRDHREPLTDFELRKLSDRSTWFLVMIAHVLYVQAATVALVPFACSDIAEGVSVLDWWPNFECGTSMHGSMRYAGFGYAGVLFVVLPSIFAYTMYKTWQNELFCDDLYRQKFGWLFRAYEHKYFWWELVGIFRRAVLVALGAMFNHSGNTQLLFAIPYLACHLFATAYFQPHLLPRHNFMDLWLQAQLLLMACYGLTNVVGNQGMYVFTTKSGSINENTRIALLPPGVSMDAIADSRINSLWLSNLLYVIIAGISMSTAFIMVIYDLYEMKLSAPRWAPMALNALTGYPLYVWDEYVSRFLSVIDLTITRYRDRNKTVPPQRPASRWAHRAMNETEVMQSKDFHSGKSVQDMLEHVVGATLENEWARNVASIRDYIKSLDKRIFAAEMYNSKSTNLPALERERNKAKKLLFKFIKDEGDSIFRALYEQQGRNEQLVWDMQELERKETHARVMQAGQEERGKQLERERDEQIRRVGDIEKWRKDYLKEKAHCAELSKHVKQARDALVLYNLEESASSEDEKELDDYLQKQITEYIESKTARKLMEEGKLDPMLHLS